MLNRHKLRTLLAQSTGDLFYHNDNAFARIKEAWETTCSTSLFAHQIKISTLDWLVPDWEGSLHETQKIARIVLPYHIIAVDGSQIYPDRHQGTLCSLVNIGIIELCYQGAHKGFCFDSIPHFFNEKGDLSANPAECIDRKRHELELSTGLLYAQQRVQEKNAESTVIWLDGSLIFWFAATAVEQTSSDHVAALCALLASSYELSIPIASYISLPSSRELVGLVRFALIAHEGYQQAQTITNDFLDTDIAALYVKEGYATRWFKSQAPVTQQYDALTHPYFAYVNVGSEIVRVETCAWVVERPEYAQLVLQTAFDQAYKGNGYPVCLAEAHEQAVIKAPDREFFYHMLASLAQQRGLYVSYSRKQLQKRLMKI